MFDEMLTGPFPHAPADMPPNRPNEILCYLDRDEDYFKEVEHLQQRAVIMTSLEDLQVDFVAELAARTEVVQASEVRVSKLSGWRYLLILPVGLAPVTFIRAIPMSVWEREVVFHPWNPRLDGNLMIPSYKVIANLVGVPVELRKDTMIAKAISSFGVYLGHISPERPEDLTHWQAVFATHDLALVPRNLTMSAGGIKFNVPLCVVTWKEVPLYTESDIPQPPETFTAPPPISSSEDESFLDETQPIQVPFRVLAEICRGRELTTLPDVVQEFFKNSGLQAMATSSGSASDEEDDTQLHTVDLTADDPLPFTDPMQPNSVLETQGLTGKEDLTQQGPQTIHMPADVPAQNTETILSPQKSPERTPQKVPERTPSP